MSKKLSQKVISKVVSKKVIKHNSRALKAYGYYRKTSDLLDRADIAMGKRTTFKTGADSTLNFEITLHGTYSTTAKKI